jgi:Uri superfamily endonuclease
MVAVPINAKNNLHPLKINGMARGGYVLLVNLPEERTITVGGLGSIHFPHGYYAYVGSALSGFRSRLNRHLRTDKKPHWHIDYLLAKAVLDAIITGETQDRTECTISMELSQQFDSVPDFGASDCRCHSHLFFGADDMRTTVVSAFQGVGLEPKLEYVREQY